MFKVGRILVSENEIPDTQKIAFQISPRINAAGRMDHASAAYNLIIENDKSKVNVLALEIESKNQERQKITSEIAREIRIVAENSFKDKKFIFVESPHWPVGILGLVAGKMAEEFNKPIAVLQKQENMLVGSFRSIPQINIIEKIEKCSEFLEKFGGHSQAAGITMKYENAQKFYEKISKLIEEELKDKDVSPEIEIDAEIRPEEINWDLIMEIKKMEPFGEGNEEPVFLLREMVVEDFKIVGNGSKHLKVFLRGKNGNPKVFDGIGFGFGEKFQDLQKGEIIDAVFNIREDEWNGNKKIQLRLVDIRRNKIGINVI